jgi:hypothetical protein
MATQHASAHRAVDGPDVSGLLQFALRSVARLGSWAVGLAVAAWVVPGVSFSTLGFIVAVVLFSTTQTALSLWILKLPHGYASLLLGCTGLTLTVLAMSLASALTHRLSIRGIASWIAATALVWLVTTIGAILLFDVYRGSETRSS